MIAVSIAETAIAGVPIAVNCTAVSADTPCMNTVMIDLADLPEFDGYQPGETYSAKQLARELKSLRHEMGNAPVVLALRLDDKIVTIPITGIVVEPSGDTFILTPDEETWEAVYREAWQVDEGVGL